MEQENSIELGRSAIGNAGRNIMREAPSAADDAIQTLPDLDIDADGAADSHTRQTVEWDYNNFNNEGNRDVPAGQ